MALSVVVPVALCAHVSHLLHRYGEELPVSDKMMVSIGFPSKLDADVECCLSTKDDVRPIWLLILDDRWRI